MDTFSQEERWWIWCERTRLSCQNLKWMDTSQHSMYVGIYCVRSTGDCVHLHGCIYVDFSLFFSKRAPTDVCMCVLVCACLCVAWKLSGHSSLPEQLSLKTIHLPPFHSQGWHSRCLYDLMFPSAGFRVCFPMCVSAHTCILSECFRLCLSTCLCFTAATVVECQRLYKIRFALTYVVQPLKTDPILMGVCNTCMYC